MGHPALENRTPFAVEPLFLLDEEARGVLTVVVKGTYKIHPDGVCRPDETQEPVVLSPVPYGDPDTSSLKLDTEAYFAKPACDVVVIGHARAQAKNTRDLLVAIRVGPVQKGILVLGDRVWVRSVGAISATAPAAFEAMPLVYEHAFGGWDRDHPDATKHAVEPRNPVGVGFRAAGGYRDGLRLPNLEDPIERLISFGQRVAPVGCGYVGPHWQPRAAFAGTYDEAWKKQRAPRYPSDFDRRHLNAGSPGLIAPFLRGDEPFTITHVGPRGGLRGHLPGGPPPAVEVRRLHANAPEPLTMQLDTVLFLCDEERVQLVWRGSLVLRRDPSEIAAIEIEATTIEEQGWASRSA